MMRGKGANDEFVFKDSSISLMRLLCFLILLVTGIMIGLTCSPHVDRYFYFTSPPDNFYVNYVSAAPPPSYSTSIEKAAKTVSFDYNCSSGMASCEKEDCLSMEGFKMPKNLTHKMTDNELFWRASLVPNKAEYPFERVPKVAFMFMTRGPLPFLKLWERFFKGQDVNKYSIYVHTNPGVRVNFSNYSVFYNRLIPSQDVRWGTVTLVDAERRLLGNALLDFSNERFVLLSESCIPIYNFPIIYNYLIGSTQSFLDSYDEPSRYGRGRYSRHMKPDIKLRDWRKGSQWFEIQRTLAIKIVSDTRYYTIFKRHCLPSCYPDEHYLPTFVNMFYGALNANRTVTYVDWSLGGPHPARFEAKDITKNLILSIRNNGTTCSYNQKNTSICFLFARKFHPSALDPLLNISSTLLGF
ncbi:core-2/I-branching beta-1,6-N-acetylglucosaminyltransferase family protein [Artemisia annua]|uniref:Core-2/I-branching beta-1,6-N-acetylglucosaminyltransferase family protein n=1 Tax=Artemisia annua TaxID=35608 RepID=A0A2U1LGQ7_ARTAN|nr:core-2/I-branching beta-1,6-N-acetylglucosaminyltransferase family protein [Artemisia annua]